MAYHEECATLSNRREENSTHVSGDSPVDLTRNEGLVYNELLQRTTPAKAYDLLDKVMDQGVRAPMTIYRALDSLIRKGLAKKVVSLNAFMAVPPDSESQMSAFMTCGTCNQTRKIDISAEYVEAIFGDAQMSLDEVFIEARGQCISDVCSRKVSQRPGVNQES